MNNIFYTYLYRDINGVPIYVGKGKEDRAYRHKYAKNHVGNVIRKYNLKPEFIVKDVDEEFAFFVEEEAIAKYGRRDLGTGTLLNRTNGGEGSSGRKMLEETREKIRQATLNQSEETKAKRQKSLTKTTHKPHKSHASNKSKNISRIPWNKGLSTGPRSEETKKKIAVSNIEKNKKIRKITELYNVDWETALNIYKSLNKHPDGEQNYE